MDKNYEPLTAAAARLGISRQRLWFLCQRGRVPEARQFGAHWFIPRGSPCKRKANGRPRTRKT